MRDLSELLAKLTPKQLEHFERRLKKAGKGMPTVNREVVLVPRGHHQPSPLSFDQERMYRLHQRDPQAPTYHVYSSQLITGPLDRDALQRSLDEIARRHEAWRTSFAEVDGRPVQIVAPSLEVGIHWHDLSDLPAEERTAEAERLAHLAVRTPFDLSQAPLVRPTLLRLSEQEHVLVWAIHHIVHDRVTYSILFRELSEHYRTFTTGEPHTLPAPQVQYADYAEWQRRWLQGETRDKMVSYWKQHLAGAPLVLDLPTDFPRPQQQTFDGRRVVFKVPARVSQAVKSFGYRAGATPFMVYLAAFYALLYRYSGQEDILVGTPFANRMRAEMEWTMGYFLTSTVMRAQMRGEMTFSELVQQMREVSVGAFANQGIPFSVLMEELDVPEDPSRNPIWQAQYMYLNHPDEQEVRLGDAVLRGWNHDGETSKSDLLIVLDEHGSGDLMGLLEYNPDLHREETIRQMSEHWLGLLSSIAADPEQTLDGLSLEGAQLEPQERFDTQSPELPVTNKTAFLFPGLGAHYVNMAAELYRLLPSFRANVDLCAEHLRTHLGYDLRDVLFAEEDASAQQGLDLRQLFRRNTDEEAGAQMVNRTSFAHPALFTIEYALSQLLIEQGVRPAAMIGHSVGEYAAACLAGVFSLEDALKIVAHRALLIERVAGGAMLAVPASLEEIEPFLHAELHLAAVNSPLHCMISGAAEHVTELEGTLLEAGIVSVRLKTVHAFHSPLMQPIIDDFVAMVSECDLHAPQIPVVSNVTGDWLTAEQATSPMYWAQHLAQTVRFAEGVATLVQDPELALAEVGPGTTLSGFAEQCLQETGTSRLVVPTMRLAYDKRSDVDCLNRALAGLQAESIGV